MGKLLTVEEVADYLRLSNLTVRRMIERGEIPAVRIGKGIRIREEDVEASLRPIVGGAE